MSVQEGAMDTVSLDKLTAAGLRAGRPSEVLPTVNLLPAGALDRLVVRRVRARLIAAGLAGALLVGGAWMLQTQQLNSARDRLAAEQALTPQLTAQVQALEPVARFFAALEQRRATASAAMAAEVLFSGALTDLAAQVPVGMDLTNMSVSLTPSVVEAVAPPVSPLAEAGIDAEGNDTTVEAPANPPVAGAPAPGTPAAGAPAPGAPSTPAAGTATPTSGAAAQPVSCARPNPFNPAPIIGCVTLSGTADSRAVVGELLRNLRASGLYADPFVTTTTVSGGDGQDVISFAGSVGLTGEAVSGRYAELSWMADPGVLAEAERMIADGNTAAKRLAERARSDAAAAKAAAEREAEAKADAERKAQKDAEDALTQRLIDAQREAQELAGQATEGAE